MALYTFVTTCNNARADSRVAFDLPDAEAAWHEATKTASELLKDISGQLDDTVMVWQIEVLNQFGKPVRLLRIVAESYD